MSAAYQIIGLKTVHKNCLHVKADKSERLTARERNSASFS